MRTRLRSLAEWIALWGLFSLIAAGLGFPTLHRYDPRASGVVDASSYYKLVEGGPGDVDGHRRYRLLVPFIAKPIYHLAIGRVGVWNPVLFGLLAVNSLLVGATGALLGWIGLRVSGRRSVGLLASCLYLLSFLVSNAQLAAHVDSAEALVVTLAMASLLADRWWPLAVLAAVGAIAKETVVPFLVVFSGGWWICGHWSGGLSWRRGAVVVGTGIVGLVAVSLLHSYVEGRTVTALAIASEFHSSRGFIAGLLSCLLDRGFWYGFVWLLPLGVLGLRHLPRAMVVASLAGGSAALALGAYNSAGGANVSRAVFDVAGPALCLASAMVLVGRQEASAARGAGGDVESPSKGSGQQ